MKDLLIHTRTADDAKVLTDNFDLSKLGSNHKFVHGLTVEAQTALLMAKATGKRIISNGLPVDVASKLGEITMVRAWDKTREDGSRTTGASAPELYHVGKVADTEAFEKLKKYPEFADAFESFDA